MENTFSPFSSSSPTALSQPNMGSPQNTLFSFCDPMSLTSMSNTSASLWENPGGISTGEPSFQTLGLSREQERKLFDAWTTKVARSKRKIARQKTLSRGPSAALNCIDAPGHAQSETHTFLQITDSNMNRDPYTFCTPDKKRLKVLLKKELKRSDVGTLGRIVLPKREAEENLPNLSDKEGIRVVIRDVYTYNLWIMRFKYWSNNKSRMYVLENAGEFIKQNGLEVGDAITLYEDESKSLYVSIRKVQSTTQLTESHRNQEDIHNSYSNGAYANGEPGDEEQASLALLIEQLNHKKHQEDCSLMTLAMDGALQDELNYDLLDDIINKGTSWQPSPLAAIDTMSTSTTHSRMKGKLEDQHHISFEDCYGGLGTLPEVSGLKCSFF